MKMSTVKFYTSWEVYTKGIANLISGNSNLDDDAEVWQGADGSYAIGDATDIYDADPDTDLDHYTAAGTVSEYRR